MNLQFKNYLAMSEKEFRNLNHGAGVSDYTDSGIILYTIGASVPVIVKGKGCMANAMIKKLTITSKGTTVTFQLEEINSALADAAYTMYRATISSGNSGGDIYEDAKDAFIPGAFKGKSSTSLKDEDDDDFDFSPINPSKRRRPF